MRRFLGLGLLVGMLAWGCGGRDDGGGSDAGRDSGGGTDGGGGSDAGDDPDGGPLPEDSGGGDDGSTGEDAGDEDAGPDPECCALIDCMPGFVCDPDVCGCV